MGATRHRPAAPGTLDSSSDGIQAPENTEAMVPVPTRRFHRSDHVAEVVSTSPSSIIFCQNSVNRWVPASSSKSMVTVLPSADVWNGWPPASQTMAS